MPSSSSSSSSPHVFLFLFIGLLLSLPFTAICSCPPKNFTCGEKTLEIQFPFFTINSVSQCSGLHYIECMDSAPVIQFKGMNYVYPVSDISYLDKSIIIKDLNLSAYFRASDCVFLYDFRIPVPGFKFNSYSVSLRPGESFFNCRMNYVFFRDVFHLDYNLSLCKDYSLHYSGDYVHRNYRALPRYCSNSSSIWFHWKLSFGGGEDGGRTSLIAAGFSPQWVRHPDCFSCMIAADRTHCGDARDHTCKCVNSCQGKKNKSKGPIVGVSIAAGILLISILSFFIYFKRQRRSQKKQQFSPSSTVGRPFSGKDPELTNYANATHIFSYDELSEATNYFDNASELGGGGFGTVYKGTLRDGRIVAVKRLYESNFKREEQFANEIVILSRLRHQNLVSLYGCTSPRSRELLLVYELVPNGTVADHLHGPRDAEGHLTWPLRLSIAVETAAALAYLHSVDPPIIHRDVKTGNILLDADFHVKVADFGLSRLSPADGATHISTAPQGTPGYLDPEYHQSYKLTDRSDVYSFGVVLAELISSKPAVDIDRDRAEINLSTMAINRIQSGKLEDLVDRRLAFDVDPDTRRTIGLVAELAFRCLQPDQEMRPPIKEVLQVLRGLQTGASFGSEKAGNLIEQVVGGAGVEKGGLAPPFSPDSVTENWVSRTTTPGTSQ